MFPQHGRIISEMSKHLLENKDNLPLTLHINSIFSPKAVKSQCDEECIVSGHVYLRFQAQT